MLQTLVFAAVVSAALVAGSVAGVTIRLPERVLALMLAFASGALITALAFELFADAYEKSGAWTAGIAFVAGAAMFIGVASWLDRRVAGASSDEEGETAKIEMDVAASDKPTPRAALGGTAGLALLAAVTLDGVPENAALGVTLAEGAASYPLLLAIFASNFPEALVGAAAMKESGRGARSAVALWAAAAVLLAAALVVGKIVFPAASEDAVSVPLAFAGGAVIASLADTLMPEAYEGGGATVAFATTAGFLASDLLSTL